MKTNAWFQEPNTQSTKSFYQEEKSWLLDPKVFIDSGRPLSSEYAPLKSRSHVALRGAQEESIRLRQEDCKEVRPQWHTGIDV